MMMIDLEKGVILMKFKLVAASLAASLLAAVPAHAQVADSVTTSVNALAGLSPVLSMTCDSVNFGVWRIPVRSTGGTTTITLTVSANNAAGVTTATPGGNTTGAGLAAGYLPPLAATCSVSGSNNLSQTIRTIIGSATNLAFGPSAHNNLSVPSTLAAMRANLALAGTGVAINGTGTGTFRVVGVLTVPQTIVSGNYGGYATEESAQVSASDQVNTTTP